MPSLSLSQLTTHIVKTLALWAARSRSRRDLMDLDDHLLRDIGVTREGAFAEARRPAWSGKSRCPEPWRQVAEHRLLQITRCGH